jgi:hypothetical protein
MKIQLNILLLLASVSHTSSYAAQALLSSDEEPMTDGFVTASDGELPEGFEIINAEDTRKAISKEKLQRDKDYRIRFPDMRNLIPDPERKAVSFANGPIINIESRKNIRDIIKQFIPIEELTTGRTENKQTLPLDIYKQETTMIEKSYKVTLSCLAYALPYSEKRGKCVKNIDVIIEEISKKERLKLIVPLLAQAILGKAAKLSKDAASAGYDQLSESFFRSDAPGTPTGESTTDSSTDSSVMSSLQSLLGWSLSSSTEDKKVK